jgi:hypothetical protein
MAIQGPHVEEEGLRVGWRISRSRDFFYKHVDGVAEGHYVLEILSNFSVFLGYIDSTGILEEWNKETLEWERRIL